MSIPNRRRAWPAIALLAITAGCGKPAPLHGVTIQPPQDVPDLRVVDADGKTFDLSALRGRVVLVYFGYTHCPDACPTTLSDWAKAKRAIGDHAGKVTFVFVSVDPDRDTPQVVQKYARQFDPDFVGLAPSGPALDAIKRAWSIETAREPVGTHGDYGVSHPAQTFVISPDGKVRMLFLPGLTWEDIASDLKRLT